MASDLFFTLQWWLIWLLMGIVFLPLTALIFSNFFDRGYIFSKILGILLLSYVAWLLGSLKLLPFSQLNLLLILGFFFLVNLKLLKLPKSFKLVKIFFLEEVLFFLSLLFWSYVRAHEPSIHGLEKYMDFGFINSILRSEFFPPKDLWMSPLSINYYYFGHLVAAVVTKISLLPSEITYNLMLATLFALTFTASFSLGANLYHFISSSKLDAKRYPLVAGFLSAFLVTLGGNLHTIYVFFQSYLPNNPVPFWQLPFQFNPSGYWYPNATRFIPNTIHEFPIYSFVVSDLHGHVLNIPFVLLFIAILITIYQSKLDARRYTLVALLIATSLMTNVLDGPIYLLGIFLIFTIRSRSVAIALERRRLGEGWQHSFLASFKSLILIALFSILLSLPFWLSFKPFGTGIGVICAPQFLINLGKIGPFLFEANHCTHSPFWMLTILWGFFYFVILCFIFFQLKSPRKLKELISYNFLILSLVLFATILILIPEFFYIKDIYPAHWRANTVFKFGYQAFIILSLVSGYLLTRMIVLKKALFLILIPLFFLVAIYPYFAISSYYQGLKTYQGLDGLKYLHNLYPDDYQAILWLRENIKGQPIILEAQGDSYTDFARVSSNTGLPTVIGWPVHEWLWRGSYDEAGKRSGEVTQLYESPDFTLTQNLLRKYQVSYVFLGTLERQKYFRLNEQKFQTLGKLVFQSGQTRIYKTLL